MIARSKTTTLPEETYQPNQLEPKQTGADRNYVGIEEQRSLSKGNFGGRTESRLDKFSKPLVKNICEYPYSDVTAAYINPLYSLCQNLTVHELVWA